MNFGSLVSLGVSWLELLITITMYNFFVGLVSYLLSLLSFCLLSGKGLEDGCIKVAFHNTVIVGFFFFFVLVKRELKILLND